MQYRQGGTERAYPFAALNTFLTSTSRNSQTAPECTACRCSIVELSKKPRDLSELSKWPCGLRLLQTGHTRRRGRVVYVSATRPIVAAVSIAFRSSSMARQRRRRRMQGKYLVCSPPSANRDMGERGELPGQLLKCGLGDKPAPQLIKAREYLSHT